MRLTMTRNGNSGMSVYINGEMFDCPEVPTTVPAKVYAVQVYTTYVEVENLDLTNEVFADPPSYVHDLVLAWQEAKEAHEAADAAHEAADAASAAAEDEDEA